MKIKVLSSLVLASISSLLISNPALAAINYQLFIGNKTSHNITIRKVEYKHKKSSWETLNGGKNFQIKSGKMTCYSANNGRGKRWREDPRGSLDKDPACGNVDVPSVANVIGRAKDRRHWKVTYYCNGNQYKFKFQNKKNAKNQAGNSVDELYILDCGNAVGKPSDPDIRRM